MAQTEFVTFPNYDAAVEFCVNKGMIIDEVNGDYTYMAYRNYNSLLDHSAVVTKISEREYEVKDFSRHPRQFKYNDPVS